MDAGVDWVRIWVLMGGEIGVCWLDGGGDGGVDGGIDRGIDGSVDEG